MDNRAIGVFDSGLGGLSVLNQLTELLPNEQFIYVADSAWCPYGNKPYEELRARTTRIVEFFLHENAKMIVVACNTATAAAIDYLRAQYTVPFVGMETAIKPAAKMTQTGSVGVLATENTFNGSLFQETREKHASHVNVVIQKGCGLVELVEENRTDSPEAFRLLKKYTQPMVEAGADYLVLGCTHYPFLTQTINLVAPSLKVIDPALPVARRAEQLVRGHDMAGNHRSALLQLFSTGNAKKLNTFAATTIKLPFFVRHLKL